MTNTNPSKASSGKRLASSTPKEVLELNLPASIDYRLRSRAVARDLQRGRIFRSEVCDATDELMRVAEGVGEPQNIPCPICAKNELVNVRFLFGKKLGPAGRCMADTAELVRITSAGRGIFTCYVVEVCKSCAWNYLIHSFPILGKG